MNNNNNNNNNLGDGQLYKKKQFSPYAVTIFKFYTGLLDKYGVMSINWAGTLLGLNKNGKTVSDQTMEELAESMLELANKLKNPEVMDAFLSVIQETEPILQEVVFSMLNMGLSVGEFVIKDLLTFVCSDTPAAPVCGLFKFASNTIDLGQDILDGAITGVETVVNTEKVGMNLSKDLEKVANINNNDNNNQNNNNQNQNNNNQNNNNQNNQNNNNQNNLNNQNNNNQSNQSNQNNNNQSNQNNNINNSLDYSNKANKNWNKAKNYINSTDIKNQYNKTKESVYNVANKASAKAKDYINSPDIQNEYNKTKESVYNVANQASDKAKNNWNEFNESNKKKTSKTDQLGGFQLGSQLGGYKKLYNEKKKIEYRINNSIHEFLYVKKRPTSKLKNKSRNKHMTKRRKHKHKY